MSRPSTRVSTVIVWPDRAAPGVADHADAGHEHGQCREHEGRTENGADADLVAAASLAVPAKRIATSGIIVSGRAVPTAARTLPTAPSARLQLVPEPLDAVGEELGRDQDDRERDDELEQLHQRLAEVRGVLEAASIAPASGAKVLRRVRQQRNVASALERDGQLALVLRRRFRSCAAARSWRARDR